MKNQVFLGLGSNMDNRKDYLEKAISGLENNPYIKVIDISSIYETEPFGGVEQSNFLNMVIKIETSLKPEELLQTTMAIEKDLERVRTIRWGPRTVDIDILVYGDEVISTKELTVPHVGLKERAFVLVPLLEIAPDIKLPTGEPVKDFLKRVSDDVNNIKIHQNK